MEGTVLIRLLNAGVTGFCEPKAKSILETVAELEKPRFTFYLLPVPKHNKIVERTSSAGEGDSQPLLVS